MASSCVALTWRERSLSGGVKGERPSPSPRLAEAHPDLARAPPVEHVRRARGASHPPEPHEEGTSMHRRQWATGAAACTLLLGGMILSQAVDAKKHSTKGEASPEDTEEIRPPPPSPVYNPYPPGILPADIDAELARVLREIDGIEQEALAQLRALPPPVLTGQPPTLQGTGMRLIQLLGKAMNYDKNISPERNSACSSCHMPYVGFSGPIPSVNLTLVAYPGTVPSRAGQRTAQR